MRSELKNRDAFAHEQWGHLRDVGSRKQTVDAADVGFGLSDKRRAPKRVPCLAVVASPKPDG